MDHGWTYKNTSAHGVLWKHHELKKLWKACRILSSGKAGEGTGHRPLTWNTVIRNCSCPYSLCLAVKVIFFSEMRRTSGFCHTASYLFSIASTHLSARSLENFPWLQMLVMKLFWKSAWLHHLDFPCLSQQPLKLLIVIEKSMMEIVVNIVN